MRFMMIVKANKDSEAGKMPSEELLAAMGKYNEELMKAEVLLDLAGLQPSSKGARIKFSGGKRMVTDGPCTETKELIAGYWLIQVKSKEEAIEWAKRCPDPLGEGMEAEIEIRQVFEVSDFPPEIFPPEDASREQALRDSLPEYYAEAVIAEFAREGVNDDALAADLQREGNATFAESWRDLMYRIASKSEMLAKAKQA